MGLDNMKVPVVVIRQPTTVHHHVPPPTQDFRNKYSSKPRYHLQKSMVLNGTFGQNQFITVVIFVLLQCALLVNSYVLDERKAVEVVGGNNSSSAFSGRLEESQFSETLPTNQFNLSEISLESASSSTLGHHNHHPKSNNQSDCHEGGEEQDKVEQILFDIFHDEHKFDEEEEEEVEEPYLQDHEEEEQQQDNEPEPLNDPASIEELEEVTRSKRYRRSAPLERLSNSSIEDSQSRTFHRHAAPPNARKKSSKHRAPHHHHQTSAQHHSHHNTVRRSRRPSSNNHHHHKKSKNVNKYNDYMDVVLKRMNSMIKTKKMDPLMVNLFSGGNNSGAKDQDTQDKDKKKKNKKKSTTRKKRKGAKNRGRSEDLEEDGDQLEEAQQQDDDEDNNEHELVMLRSSSDSDEIELDNDHDQDNENSDFRKIRALIINGSMKRSAAAAASESSSTSTEKPETTTSPPSASSVAPINPTKTETRGFDQQPGSATEEEEEEEESRKHSSKKKSTKKESKEKSSSKSTKKNDKNKKKQQQQQQKPTRGVLKGLSSLRRNGNVDVIRQGDKVRIVRANFLLGPVTLEIVPKSKKQQRDTSSKGKNNKKKSTVTAVAHQLKGIIEVRLKKNSPTTIKRLRVFPPSSVKIKSTGKNAKKKSSSSKSSSSNNSSSSVPRYSRVTPVATHRLRQIATAVVRQADVKRKTTGLVQPNNNPGKN